MSNKQFVHFRLDTGKIVQLNRGSSVDEHAHDGVYIGHHRCDEVTHPDQWRVDLASLQMAGDHNFYVGTFVRNEPTVTVEDVKSARMLELDATDDYINWPHDRPGAEEMRARWTPYRQSLRDLGRFTTVNEMLAAWPLRPDDLDAVAHLRERMTKASS
jgi:hypothetical protein